MDVEIFFGEIRGSVANLIAKTTPGFGFGEDANNCLGSI